MASHHEQQASQCYGEQQHRVLWPAYNPNLPPLQASTERLFQQTRLIASTALKVSTSVALSIQPSNNGKLARVPRFVTDDQSHKLGNAHSTRAWAIQIHLAQPLNLFS